MLRAQPPYFAEGEDVLCFHGPLLYPANIQKIDIYKGEQRFFVHYHKWGNKYDEWVHVTRVLKKTKETKGIQRRIMESTSRKGSVRRKTSTSGSTGGGEKAAKRSKRSSTGGAGPEEGVEAEDEYLSRLDVRLNIPDDLKHKLLEDWEKINKSHKLLRLPCKPTVAEIIDDYATSAANKPRVKHIVGEVAAGIKVYFRQGLPTVLLYAFERPQYNSRALEEPDVDVCDVYGAEHLLRLFVKLPALLVHTDLNAKATAALTACLHDLMRHIQKNAAKMITGTYEDTSATYRKMATKS